jgi:hypothetical protein
MIPQEFFEGILRRALPCVDRAASAAGTGFAGDFRGWFPPPAIVIWSSKIHTSSRLGLRPSRLCKGT